MNLTFLVTVSSIAPPGWCTCTNICVTTQQKTGSVCMFLPSPVFNSLLVATLKHVKEFFTNVLKLKKNSEKANPSSSSKWSKVKTTMKTYTCDLISVKNCLVWSGSCIVSCVSRFGVILLSAAVEEP